MAIENEALTVDQLKKEIAALRRENREFRRLVSFPESTPVPVLEWAPGEKVVYLNRAAQELLEKLSLPDEKSFLPPDLPDIYTRATSSKVSNDAIPQFMREVRIGERVYQETIVYSPEYHTLRIFVVDNTHRKQVEEELKAKTLELTQTQEFIEAVTKGNEVIIATIDLKYCYTYFNQAYREEVKRLSGTDIQLGMNMLEAFAHLPDLQKVVQEEWSQVLGGESTNKLLNFGDPGRHRRVYNVLHTPIWDDEHNVVGAGEVAYDISEQVHAQEALLESEARYHQLFNGMTEGFAVHEVLYDDNQLPIDYRFLDVNPAFEHLTGLHRLDILGKTYHEVLPDEGDTWVNIYGKVVSTGEPIRFEQFSTSLNRYYEVYAYRCAPDQFATVFMDITERKKMESELRVNLTKYSVLFDSLPLGVTITDQEGRILESNQEAEKILGLAEEEHTKRMIDGKEWDIIRTDRTPMPVEEYASMRALKENIRVENMEMGLRKDGDHVTWLSVTAAPIPLTNYGVVITYKDVSARIQAEEALHLAHEMLEHTVEQRTRELVTTNNELWTEIAARKRIQEELLKQTEAVKAERQRFNNVLEILPIYTIILTPDYHVSFANRYFRERFGTDQGDHCYEFLFNRQVPCGNCESNKVLETGTSHQWEWTAPDGSNYDIFDFPFKDSDGSDSILELGIDITKRKQAEEQLRALNNYNRSLLEASPDALLTITPEGKIGYVNAVTETITGYPREILIGSDFHNYFTDPGKARQAYQQVFETGIVRDYELEVHHRDGQVTPVTYNASVFKGESGDVVGVFATARDITEQKQAAEALRQSEEKYRSLVIATAQIVWQTNSHGEVVEDIPKWREYTGQTINELMGRGWINALHPDDRERVERIWAQAVENESFYDTEYRIRNVSGAYGEFSVRGVPIKDEDNHVSSWIGTCTDVTDKKNIEKQLIQYEKHAVIGRMLGSVTHEINNPLQTIKNCLYLLKQDIKSDEPSCEPLEMALSETQRMTNIVAQLRQLYRPQSMQKMRREDLFQLIEEVHGLITAHLIDKNVKWQFTASQERYSIYCMKDQIIEVFLNISLNAIEAMQVTGGTLSVNVVHDAEHASAGVIFCDTGPGISSEILPHLFEPFITTKDYGLGLGLSICYEIIQKHHGQITVDGRPGHGTSFTIWLPLHAE